MAEHDCNSSGGAAASEGGSVDYVITLVHGTFARETAWVKEGSALRKSLEPLGRVRFETFKWTGHNNHTARLTAGRELAQHLDLIRTEHPAAKRIVIAHSHGGNVALYAGRHLADPSSLQHLACLATPFLYCGILRSPMRLLLNLLGLSIAGGILMMEILIRLLRHGASYRLGVPFEEASSPITTTETPLLYLSILLAFAAFCFALTSSYASRLLDERTRALAWQPLRTTNMLSMAYRADEAERLLRFTNALATRPSRLIWLFVEIAGVLAAVNIGFELLGNLLLTFAPPETPAGAMVPGWLLPRTPHSLSGVLFQLYLFASIMLGIGLLAFVFPLIRGNPWAYGWERPSLALLMDVVPRDRPSGLQARSIEHFEIPIGAFGKGRWMAHTVIYDDERIQQKLRQWIESDPPASPDGRMTVYEEPQYSSNRVLALPWRQSRFSAMLALPLLLACGITLALPTSRGIVWLDLEPLQYALAAVLGAFGGLAGFAAVALATFVKCFRYAGELDVLSFEKLRVIHRGSIGEAGALIAVTLMFAQRHRLRLTLNADTLTLRQMLFLAALSLVIFNVFFTPLYVTTSPFAWLLLIAFLLGLSGITLAGLAPALVLLAAVGILAALGGFAPLGKLAPWILPPGLGTSLTLGAPMQALNLYLVALLGRGLRQRLWPGAADEPRHAIAWAVTAPTGLSVWVLMCLVFWCFTISITFGSGRPPPFQPLVTLPPQFATAISLLAFTTGALYGTRGVVALALAYLGLGLCLPTAMALLANVGTEPMQSAYASLPLGALLKFEYTIGHLQFGRGLELPVYGFLGAVTAANAPEFRRNALTMHDQARAADAKALGADDIVMEARQQLPALAFRVLDIAIVIGLLAILSYGVSIRFRL